MADTPQIPIQPVANPILCNPFNEPTSYWHYDEQGVATEREGRRPAGYYYLTDRTGTKGTMLPGLIAEENWDDLPLINRLRADVKRWREKEYEGATQTTKALLRYWQKKDRPRRLFFCQLESVETIIYLTEILAAGKKPFGAKARLELNHEDFQALIAGEKPKFAEAVRVPPTLLDKPIDDHQPGLRRYGCKMATGSGKTVVMAMVAVWSLCNRGKNYSDERFPSSILIVCPNLTVKERLQVLRPDHAENYYQAFDLVPPMLLPELKKGRVLIENWHQLGLESEHAEGGKSYGVVQKGEESPEAFAQRVLGDLYGNGPILVFNDEAHHAYRPAPLPPEKKLSADEKDEREEATLWIQGLDRINQGAGIKFCVDLSATPFHIQGSGFPEGSPFPWLVSDFGLVDAIESGITKIPRIPVSDNTGRPDPKYFALWRYIMDRLKPGEKLPGGKPKPEVMWRESEDALKTLASQWKKTMETIEAAKPGQFRIPPVMIVVCDNTDIASEFYRNISGETTVAAIPDEDEDDKDEAPKKKKKAKAKVVYGQGKVFPEQLSNREGLKATIRIDSKLLAEAESEMPNTSRKEAGEELREIVATVGRPGKPGEQVRCVVSVQMLSEGWDANNVTHILGLRAFGSQLLCEQVVGRGLRRMNYQIDPKTGLLPEEYVDIYGIPFSVIPFKGQSTTKPTAPEPPKNHVHALDERKHFEIRFPVVEGFAFDIRKNKITADVKGMEKLVLEPETTPTAVFVKPQVGYTLGGPNAQNNFKFEVQDRTEYYKSVHLQTIQFEIARQIVTALTDTTMYGKPRMQAQGRQELFPQVFNFVREYSETKINWKGCKPQELGLDRYVKLVVGRFLEAIRPDEAQGEPPIIPLLHSYRPTGSTSMVDFLTIKPVHAVNFSHLNQVAADTGSWEQAATFALEKLADEGCIRCFARNERLEFNIPYEFLGNDLSYFPDFLVQVREGYTLILEIKGQEDNQDLAKYEAAKRWVRAVNHWGKEGEWGFVVCRDPQTLTSSLLSETLQESRTKI